MTSLSSSRKIVLSLCDYSGVWSDPYIEAGYRVIQLDLKHGDDIRFVEYHRSWGVHGILAAPPCTHFAASGARWDRSDKMILQGLSIVDACLRIVMVYKPDFWCLENPVGKLARYLGPPRHTFHPCDYGDPWTKKTMLWGNFVKPTMNPVEPVEGSKTNRMSGATQRSMTPPGFARAFYEANP